jgi:hypothetical protein
VFREHLHMHATGVSVFNTQTRAGGVIRQGSVEFWDFNQQGNLAVPEEPFEILPGDGFRTTCNHNAKEGERWGIASSEDKRMAFILLPLATTPSSSRSFSPGNNVEFPFMCSPGFLKQLVV